MTQTADKTFTNQNARVDESSVQPFPRSEKIYIQGSRPDIQVPMREISLHDTPTDFGGEKNSPVRVYDTSGPYTDPELHADVREGLADIRSAWINDRSDTEFLDANSSDFTQERLHDQKRQGGK